MKLFITPDPLNRMQRKLNDLAKNQPSSIVSHINQLIERIKQLQIIPVHVPQSFVANTQSYSYLLRSSCGMIVEDWLTKVQGGSDVISIQEAIEQAEQALNNYENWLRGSQVNSNTLAVSDEKTAVVDDYNLDGSGPRSGPFSR